MAQAEQILDRLAGIDYEPIGDYGIIGDCRSAALVSMRGSIDWLCWPDFSSPSLFAALLDRVRGGRFLICPHDIERISRRYVGWSAVLETTFQCSHGVICLTDFMPILTTEAGDIRRQLCRRVECLSGEAVLDVAWQPRPGYAESVPDIRQHGERDWRFDEADAAVMLHTDLPLHAVGADLVGATIKLRAGDSHAFLQSRVPHPAPSPHGNDVSRVRAAKDATLAWWRAWCDRGTYDGFHAEEVMRSCLTLKLLSYRDSGAIMAAATTSLPESLGASRNWDYRYCWLRDTSLLLQSFVDIGFEEESLAFLNWLLHVGRQPRLRPLYDLHGQQVSDDRVLGHLEGYRGVSPVRLGNTASSQLQLDIYGEVVQTAYRFVCRGGVLNRQEQALLAELGNAVCTLWREPDESIWEGRGTPRHYTYSKIMCWVALDRLADLHRRHGLALDTRRIVAERDAIRQRVEAEGYDRQVDSYVSHFGGTTPDASLLLMVRYGFHEPHDRRVRNTWRYIGSRLSSGGLLYRYPTGQQFDGVPGRDNVFLACNFWLADFLARSGEVDEAIAHFERLLRLANDLGLYSEQFDPNHGLALGNFPQAFSHTGLVTAAIAIQHALEGRRGGEIPT
jgi:GH15 family glucan-1,4-alpha-glucosidase